MIETFLSDFKEEIVTIIDDGSDIGLEKEG